MDLKLLMAANQAPPSPMGVPAGTLSVVAQAAKRGRCTAVMARLRSSPSRTGLAM